MKPEPYVRQAQYYETDQMGIIHHANYIYWMEEARVDYMEKIGFGYDKAVEAGIDFALLSISCKYKGMTKFREKINILVFVKNITSMKMTVGYQMTGASDNRLRFEAESEHCYYSANKRRPVSLKKELPELFELFCKLSEEAPANLS